MNFFLDKNAAPLYGGPMSHKAISTLKKRRHDLLEQLHRIPNLMRGVVYEKTHKCGRKSCTCASGGPKHPTRQLTVTLGGRTQTRYVRVEEMEDVERLIETYHDLWRIVEELTEVNLDLLRGGHPREEEETR